MVCISLPLQESCVIDICSEWKSYNYIANCLQVGMLYSIIIWQNYIRSSRTASVLINFRIKSVDLIGIRVFQSVRQ